MRLRAHRLLLSWLTACFALAQSSLLSVFVPQLCPDPEPHVCTLYDNCACPMGQCASRAGGSCADSRCRLPRAVHDLTPFNKAAVGINFITLFYYLFVQSVLAGREYWCVRAPLLAKQLPLSPC